MRIEITGAAPDNDNVITVAGLKQHLRVTHSAEDTLIQALRDAAIAYVEGYCNTKFQSTSAVAWLRGFYRQSFPVGPVTAIDNVKYQTTSSKAADDLTTLAETSYFTTTETQPAEIDFIQPPVPYEYSNFPVQVEISYGHSVAPAAMIHAVRLLVASMYENRQQEVGYVPRQIQMGVHALLAQYRYILQP